MNLESIIEKICPREPWSDLALPLPVLNRPESHNGRVLAYVRPLQDLDELPTVSEPKEYSTTNYLLEIYESVPLRQFINRTSVGTALRSSPLAQALITFGSDLLGVEVTVGENRFDESFLPFVPAFHIRSVIEPDAASLLALHDVIHWRLGTLIPCGLDKNGEIIINTDGTSQESLSEARFIELGLMNEADAQWLSYVKLPRDSDLENLAAAVNGDILAIQLGLTRECGRDLQEIKFFRSVYLGRPISERPGDMTNQQRNDFYEQVRGLHEQDVFHLSRLHYYYTNHALEAHCIKLFWEGALFNQRAIARSPSRLVNRIYPTDWPHETLENLARQYGYFVLFPLALQVARETTEIIRAKADYDPDSCRSKILHAKRVIHQHYEEYQLAYKLVSDALKDGDLGRQAELQFFFESQLRAVDRFKLGNLIQIGARFPTEHE